MGIELPPGMKNGFVVQAQVGGKARLHVIKGGKPVAHFDCDEEFLGDIAGSLLLQAKNLSAHLVEPPSGDDFNGFVIQPTTVGVVGNPTPGFETLAFRLGKAQIGFVLPHATLKVIGAALLAASAEEGRPH
jgi:hypothetical protein